MSMELLERLVAECKGSVTVTVNDHRDNRESVAEMLDDDRFRNSVTEESRKLMIDADRVVVVQFYPDTPVGFYLVLSHDIGIALNMAWNALLEARGAGLDQEK